MKTILAVNKPKGPTSHDIIDEIRRITGVQKVGHAGTLDPLAHVVLVVGVGRDATRQLASIVQKEKEYVAQITFGQTSTTDDAEGEKTSWPVTTIPSQEDILSILPSMTGKIAQIPPSYSAIKVRGVRAYRAARKGKAIPLVARKVEIKNIELLSYAWPIVTLRVTCGPGVYLRSLARDLGQALHTGGYLSDLERTRVGQFTLDQALKLKLETKSPSQK
jgi:tRNA pseudouridine55 synthase